MLQTIPHNRTENSNGLDNRNPYYWGAGERETSLIKRNGVLTIFIFLVAEGYAQGGPDASGCEYQIMLWPP